MYWQSAVTSCVGALVHNSICQLESDKTICDKGETLIYAKNYACDYLNKVHRILQFNWVNCMLISCMGTRWRCVECISTAQGKWSTVKVFDAAVKLKNPEEWSPGPSYTYIQYILYKTYTHSCLYTHVHACVCKCDLYIELYGLSHEEVYCLHN